jgi:hypothetical protein
VEEGRDRLLPDLSDFLGLSEPLGGDLKGLVELLPAPPPLRPLPLFFYARLLERGKGGGK